MSLISFLGRSAGSPPFAGVLGGGGEWWGGADDGSGLRFLKADCPPFIPGDDRGSVAGDPVRAVARDESKPGSAVRFAPAGVAMMVEEVAGAALRTPIFSRMRLGSLSQALKRIVTSFVGRPFTPFSTLGTFFGRSTPWPSSLFRFTSGFGRFSVTFVAPFG